MEFHNFPSKRATLRIETKLAGIARDGQKGLCRNSQSKNPTVPRVNEEYITQVTEDREGRLTRIDLRSSVGLRPCFWVLFFIPDEFLQNPRLRLHSRTLPGTSRSMNSEKQEPTGDSSQNAPCP